MQATGTSSCLQFRRGELGPARRLVIAALATWPILGVYMIINHHQLGAPAILRMPSWVPFWPGFALPYTAMLVSTWLLPVSIRDPRRFRTCLWAIICGYAVVVPFWMFMPTTLPRPELPEGFWSIFFKWLWTADPPNNVTPCAHGIGPSVAVWFVSRERPTWRWPMVVFLLLGIPSIAFTWQHRPTDILMGLGIAFATIACFEKSYRQAGTPAS